LVELECTSTFQKFDIDIETHGCTSTFQKFDIDIETHGCTSTFQKFDIDIETHGFARENGLRLKGTVTPAFGISTRNIMI